MYYGEFTFSLSEEEIGNLKTLLRIPLPQATREYSPAASHDENFDVSR